MERKGIPLGIEYSLEAISKNSMAIAEISRMLYEVESGVVELREVELSKASLARALGVMAEDTKTCCEQIEGYIYRSES